MPLHKFEQRLLQLWPQEKWRGVTILAGVSGGADSTALFVALSRIQRETSNDARIVAAHLNHQLRGEESKADEQFVRELAARYQAECVVESWENAAASEESARNARYDFFERAAKQLGARCIALAHTADDQIETVLHRIIRGTSLHGLAGIPFSREFGDLSIVRPLLQHSRKEVESYLAALNQPFCTDATNETPAFTRNRIRNELLPMLRADFNPQVDDALLRLGAMALEVGDVVDGLTDDWLQQTKVVVASHEIKIGPVETSASEFIVSQAIRKLWRDADWPQQAMGFEHWRKLARMLLTVGDEKHVLPGDIQVRTSDGALVMTRDPA